MITSAADPESARRSRIVLGTFALADNEVSPALLDRYHAAGGRALDLANVYLDGEAARAAGTWLPVIGTVSPAHLDEALAAAAIGLTTAEAAWLERGDTP